MLDRAEQPPVQHRPQLGRVSGRATGPARIVGPQVDALDGPGGRISRIQGGIVTT
jgi:hypothetical protein